MREIHGTEAVRQGGTTTKQRYGHEHFVAIGAKGGTLIREKYGKSYFAELGRRGGRARKKRADSPAPITDA